MPPEGNLINVQPKTGYTPTSQIQNWAADITAETCHCLGYNGR
jgi:hypothetical protein